MGLSAPNVAPNPPPGIPVQTPEGIKFTNPRNPTAPASPVVPGTENTLPIQAAARQQAQDKLRGLEQSYRTIYAQVRARIPSGVPFKPEKYVQFFDKEAQSLGFKNWQDVLDQTAEARKAAGAPPPPITPQQAAPATPGRPPVKQGATAPTPLQKKPQIEADKLDRMLQMLRQ
jgi:hypothetical protein